VKALRVMMVLSFLLLGGCLVVFREPLPANEQPPMALLGEWSRTNEWGEQMFLDISRASASSFTARLMTGSPDNLEGAEEYTFSINRSGHRWYFSMPLPKRFGQLKLRQAGLEPCLPKLLQEEDVVVGIPG